MGTPVRLGLFCRRSFGLEAIFNANLMSAIFFQVSADVFRCAVASLKEVVSVCRSVRPSLGASFAVYPALLFVSISLV